MADMTQLTGDYAAAWLPWIMIPMIFYILPFPVFAIVFLWIEREGNRQNSIDRASGDRASGNLPLDVSRSAPMGADAMTSSSRSPSSLL